jgi:hypothetical protein
MVKIRAPVYSLFASGWLGKDFYHRTGVVVHPYPIGLWGRYLVHPIYYNPLGWNYERRRTWHGLQPVAKKATFVANPDSIYQLACQFTFYNAVMAWQSLDESAKDIYNKMKYPNKMSGYNRFIGFYMNERYTFYTWADDRIGWADDRSSWSGFAT